MINSFWELRHAAFWEIVRSPIEKQRDLNQKPQTHTIDVQHCFTQPTLIAFIHDAKVL